MPLSILHSDRILIRPKKSKEAASRKSSRLLTFVQMPTTSTSPSQRSRCSRATLARDISMLETQKSRRQDGKSISPQHPHEIQREDTSLLCCPESKYDPN